MVKQYILEAVNTRNPQLFFEAKLYKYLLQDNQVFDKGIPQVYFCATEGDFNILAMEYLGSSLEDLFNLCNRKYSLKTVLMLMDQMLARYFFNLGLNMCIPGIFCTGISSLITSLWAEENAATSFILLTSDSPKNICRRTDSTFLTEKTKT